MTNNDFIHDFIFGDKEYGACNHLMCYSDGDTRYLVNYSTVILYEDTEGFHFNNHKYSRTTSKIQSYIKSILDTFCLVYDEYDGGYCTYWNCGYMGAEKWYVRDLKERGFLK